MKLLKGSVYIYILICAFLALEQQIAFKNLVQRNQANEASAQSPPSPGSVIQLPFIILNTDVRTVIDCSISSDKYEIFLDHFVYLLLLVFVSLLPFKCCSNVRLNKGMDVTD